MKQLLIAVLAVALGLAAMLAQTAVAQVGTNGFVAGKETGTASAAVSKTISLPGDQLLTVVWTASGGNFGSKFALVSVSVDNSNFILVDNVSLSTNTKVAKWYSEGTKATTVAVNPAVYPFVKLETSAGNSGVTETITWTAQRLH